MSNYPYWYENGKWQGTYISENYISDKTINGTTYAFDTYFVNHV